MDFRKVISTIEFQSIYNTNVKAITSLRNDPLQTLRRIVQQHPQNSPFPRFKMADRVGFEPTLRRIVQQHPQNSPFPRFKMADRVGFEPTVPLLAHTLSRRAHSTTLAPVLFSRTSPGVELWRARTLGYHHGLRKGKSLSFLLGTCYQRRPFS